MSIKYLVKPGYVTSQYDGDTHFVTFSQLIRLYGVKSNECINADTMQMTGNKDGWEDDLIVLEPRYDGEYEEVKQ